MKTLLILRHAKAEPQADHQADHDRPLAERGAEEAPRIGRWLCQHELAPQIILASTALRAKETAELVAQAMQFAGEVQLFRELYMATPQTYVEILRDEAGDADRALVVGHNPTLDDLLYLLTGSHEGFPTAGLAVVELAVERWEDLQLPTRHTLARFVKGKEL